MVKNRWRLFVLLIGCVLPFNFTGAPFALAEDTKSEASEASEADTEKTDIFTSTTFMSRLMGYATNSHISSPLHRNVVDVTIEHMDDDGYDKKKDNPTSASSGAFPPEEKEQETDMSKIFDKYKGTSYNREEYDRRLKEILSATDPLYGTEYNREWGRACMTTDYKIPDSEYLVHFDVFDPFTPPGLDFEDLRCLHLYNVKPGYHLYKIRMGDMVVTLRPDLEQVSVHIFEDFWGLMIVRVLYSLEGVLNRHEYTEQSRGSKTFQKTKGPAIYYSSPAGDTSDIRKWLDEKYSVLSKRRPPIIEEVLYYPEE